MTKLPFSLEPQGQANPDGWQSLASNLVVFADISAGNDNNVIAYVLYDAACSCYMKAASATMGHNRRQRYEEAALRLNEVLRSIPLETANA